MVLIMANGIDTFFRKHLWKIGVAVITLIIWSATFTVTTQVSIKAQAKDFDDMRTEQRTNEGQFYELVETIQEIKDTVIEISVNQGHIMRELGIEIK